MESKPCKSIAITERSSLQNTQQGKPLVLTKRQITENIPIQRRSPRKIRRTDSLVERSQPNKPRVKRNRLEASSYKPSPDKRNIRGEQEPKPNTGRKNKPYKQISAKAKLEHNLSMMITEYQKLLAKENKPNDVFQIRNPNGKVKSIAIFPTSQSENPKSLERCAYHLRGIFNKIRATSLPSNEAIVKSIEIDLKNQNNPFAIEDFRRSGILASEFGIEQFKIAMSPNGLNLSINQSRKLARLIYNTTGRQIGKNGRYSLLQALVYKKLVVRLE